MPLISVIIPTTRRPELLVRAVGSVLTQTLTDLEVIIVVDGPNPETFARLKEITDGRIRVIQNLTPLGAAEARNVGVAKARSEWLAFLDDDDQWVPHKLERQLAIAGSADAATIISCLAEIITSNGRYVWPRRIYDNSIPLADYLFDRKSFFKGETGLQTSCLVMARKLFDSLKFTYAHDDWDLVLRAVALRNVRIVTVAEPLVIFYQDKQRAALSASFPWRSSLDWIEQNRPFVSRRAYSGFCLTVVAPQAAKTGKCSVFFMLLYRAFRNGFPRPTHIVLYLVFWLRLRPLIGNVLRRVTSSQVRRLRMRLLKS
jgi:glycosyltransferase involved in cell wall biosynthesis